MSDIELANSRKQLGAPCSSATSRSPRAAIALRPLKKAAQFIPLDASSGRSRAVQSATADMMTTATEAVKVRLRDPNTRSVQGCGLQHKEPGDMRAGECQERIWRLWRLQAVHRFGSAQAPQFTCSTVTPKFHGAVAEPLHLISGPRGFETRNVPVKHAPTGPRPSPPTLTTGVGRRR